VLSFKHDCEIIKDLRLDAIKLAARALFSYAGAPMGNDPLADTISRARRGDAAAFDALIDGYADRLYGYFYRLTGSHHEAEDLLQDLFVRLVRALRSYEHRGRFDAWLFQMAANLARDRIRQLSRSKQTGSEALKLDSEPAPGDQDPAARMDRQEQIDRLQQALARLSESEREVLCLRHFSQLSFREIADLMGTPLGTALARAHRGLDRLRSLMGPAEQ
jgi:RNA polymerase sigma-70 factor (ECF subfamily)